MLDVSAVQNLVASWWFDYDQGHFDAWPNYFTEDVRFMCRSDSGETEVEALFSADLTGRHDVVAWQVEHRRNSPYPLRHNATNVHLVASEGDDARFRSYLFVTKIVDGVVSNVATAICVGGVREEAGRPTIADLQVIIDFANSEVFLAAVDVPPPGL